MATEQSPRILAMTQPSSSQMPYSSHPDSVNKRAPPAVNGETYDDAYYGKARHSEPQEWYYPIHNSSDSDEPELPAGVKGGNWGKKNVKGARWVRRGKATPWGPSRGEWETEERARRRLKQMLSRSRSRSPSPPTLPHLQESPPPMAAPYVPPATEHTSYASFVLDPAMTHSYRTHLLADLQQTTENLIQGEAMLNRAFGRLWKVLSEEEHVRVRKGPEEQAKRGDGAGAGAGDADGEVEDEEMSERERRIARAPELSQPIHKLFLTPFPNGGAPILEPSHFGSPQMQLENMEKNLATLRELQDDSREYVERLEEIREGLGDVRRQRDFLWMKVRGNALEELEELNEKDAETHINGEL